MPLELHRLPPHVTSGEGPWRDEEEEDEEDKKEEEEEEEEEEDEEEGKGRRGGRGVVTYVSHSIYGLFKWVL